jgi:hypothetical protein
MHPAAQSRPACRSFQSWLGLGQDAGRFKLVAFDFESQALSVQDARGHVDVLTMPGASTRDDGVGDNEYLELCGYLGDRTRWKGAPVLSREKARAFFLRRARENGEAGGDKAAVVLDLNGATLPAERKATWARDKAKALAEGAVLLAIILDGRTQICRYPLRPDYMLPDLMTRNLLDSDWEEIASLDASYTLRNHRPVQMPNNFPQPAPATGGG